MIVVLSTSDSEKSRGAQQAEALTRQLAAASPAGATLIDWGADPGTATTRIATLGPSVSAVVLVAPVRNFGIAAPTKAAIEQLADLFRQRPVGIVMTAGTPRSLLAVQSLIMPLMLDFQSAIYPMVVHLPGEPDEDARLARFTRGFVRFSDALSTAGDWYEVDS